MQKIDERNTAQSAETAADPGKFTKSQSLPLDNQTIRTMTGPELRIVGGGIKGHELVQLEVSWSAIL